MRCRPSGSRRSSCSLPSPCQSQPYGRSVGSPRPRLASTTGHLPDPNIPGGRFSSPGGECPREKEHPMMSMRRPLGRRQLGRGVMAKMTAFVATLVVFLSLLSSTAGASGVAFSDDFESGSLSQWTVRNGATIQQQEVYAGMWAARATSTGGQAYAYKTLSTSQPNLFYDHRFKVLSQGGGNVSVVRFLTSSGGAIFTIMRGPTGRLIYYNQVTGVSTTSTTAVPTGAWHELEVHAFINGSGSSVEVWLDGAKINDLSKTDSLGTTPIGRVLIGDSATGRTFDVAFDNVIVSASSDVTPPVPPTALTATAIASNHVNLTWTAATDNVGVTGYTIYRGGTAIGTVRGTTSGYADFSTSPFITYSYTVDAFDGAGNHSGQATPASATTPSASGGYPMVMAAAD